MTNLRARLRIGNSVILVMGLPLVYAPNAVASEAHRVRNQEYHFSVAFPGAVHVCIAASGDHPHGFFVRLGPSQPECGVEVKSDVGVISVYGYSNATFENSPEEEIAGLCNNSGAEDGTGTMKGLKFIGRHSARCQLRHADGSIDIYVVTQAGQWPGPRESQELRTPYINYTASLHTTKDRIPEDLKTFANVLNSVRIGYPK